MSVLSARPHDVTSYKTVICIQLWRIQSPQTDGGGPGGAIEPGPIKYTVRVSNTILFTLICPEFRKPGDTPPTPPPHHYGFIAWCVIKHRNNYEFSVFVWRRIIWWLGPDVSTRRSLVMVPRPRRTETVTAALLVPDNKTGLCTALYIQRNNEARSV